MIRTKLKNISVNNLPKLSHLYFSVLKYQVIASNQDDHMTCETIKNGDLVLNSFKCP